MPAWPTTDLDTIGDGHEIDIAAVRADGSIGRWTTIWVVRVGDAVFVRSFHGPNGSWYRASQAAGRGRIRVGDLERDVAFEPVGDRDRGTIDAAYRTKYGRSSYVDAMVTDDAAAATLRLAPNDKEQP